MASLIEKLNLVKHMANGSILTGVLGPAERSALEAVVDYVEQLEAQTLELNELLETYHRNEEDEGYF